MNDSLTGSFQLMKSLNRSLVLNTIRQFSPISRAEIAKLTKLTPPTVSSLVKELLEAGIVIETELGESKGGRKPTMLVINSSGFYIIGLDVGPSTIKAVITDLNASILSYIEAAVPLGIEKTELLILISDTIKTLLKSDSIDHDKILGIGVGMHGIVDVEQGISLFAPILQLRDIPIKDYLEKEFKMLVKVENDVRAMALGESWFGAGRGTNSVVSINIGRGIGAGMIYGGKLFHGIHSIAGEIGHMTIDIGGPKCSCGNYGCLQALASGPCITEKAVKEISMGKDSLIKELVHGDLLNISGEIVFEAAKKNDSLAKEILNQTGIYLGIGITNLIHTINPDRIIIGGGVAKAGHFILDSLKETIHQRALTDQAKKTDILLSELGDQATLIGASTLVLTEIFSTPTE